MNSSALIGYGSILVTFFTVTAVAYGFGKIVANKQARTRLQQVVVPRRLTPHADLTVPSAKLAAVMETLSQLSLPEDGWQNSETKLKFIRAGYRDGNTLRIYYSVKTVLSIVAPLLVGSALLLFNPGIGLTRIAMISLVLAAFGYYLPDSFLNMRTRARNKEMREALPDLLDLLVICIESGLGLDAALARVSREIARSSPVLSEEFYLSSLEIRAGSGRIVALRNLSLRVDIDDMYNLISMLVQADKFGTSLGASLRIQSEVMRVKRMQRAEEIAAKIPVKMLFPLIFFIFPSLMFVILGPAFIQMMRALGD